MSKHRNPWAMASIAVVGVVLLASQHCDGRVKITLSNQSIVWERHTSGEWIQVGAVRPVTSIDKELQRLVRLDFSYSASEVGLWTRQSSYEAVKGEWKAMRRTARSLTTGKYWDNRFRDELRNRLDEIERARGLRLFD